MSDKKRAPALMDEYPILVYPSLAVALGVNRAIVFQQLHFLLNGQKEAKNEYNFVDGKWWVYNSYQEWHDSYFAWLAPVTLKGIFNSLEDDGLIISMQSVKNPSDRRKWYTINYEAWDKFYPTIGQKVSDEPTDKKYPMVGQKVSDGYSETSSEDTSEKDTRKSANTPSKTKSQKPLPANRKDWTWGHIERYAVENPGIEDLAECYETGMVYTLKQLPTRAIALDCIELFEEMQRNGKNDYSGLWLHTTFKPEYSPFKCMLWALPNWLKGETQPRKKTAHERMIDELKALPPEEIIPPLMRFQNDKH